MLAKLLGINWKTTITGLMIIVGLVVKIIADVKTKDFQSAFTNLQLVVPDIIAFLMALGLLSAKDANVTGVGTVAVAVQSDGTKVNVDGEVVGKQPAG